VLIARFLGMEEFGLFALAWLGVYFAQNLQIATIVAPMMTIGAKQPKSDHAAYTGAMLVQQAVLAVATTIFVYLAVQAGDWLVPDWKLGETAIPLTLLVFIGQFSDFFRRYYFAFDKARISLVIDFLRYGSQIVLLFSLFLYCTTCSVAAVLYIMAGAALLGIGPALFFFGPTMWSLVKLRQVISRHWVFSRWLLVSAIAQWSREYFVHTAVGAMLGLADVGALRAAQQLVRVVNVPIQGFDNIVPMRASAAYLQDGFGGLVDFIDGFVLRYQAGIAIALVCIALSGDVLLSTVYGADYAGYGYLVAAYASVLLIYLLRTVVSAMLRAMETTTFEFHASLAAGILIAVTAYPLVQTFGVAGSMAALAMYESVFLMFLSLGLPRQRISAL